MQKYSRASIAMSLLLLAGCDSGQSGNQEATITSDELTLPMPERIRSINALDPNDINGTAIVNGVPVTLQRNSDGGFSGDIQVPAQSTFPVEIEFSEQFSGQNLVLATSTQEVTTGITNQQLNFSRSSYDFASHDADGDSASNIVEREEDTDPFDATDNPLLINVAVLARRPQSLQASDFSGFFFEANVGSDTQLLSASGIDFQGDFLVADQAPVTVSVQMIETVTGQQLAVATQTRELNAITDQQTVIFENNAYSSPDTDNDGQSDLAELIAGTDPTTPNSPPAPPPTNTLTTLFSVPAEIQDAQSIFAEFRLDDQLVSDIVRMENSYTATTNAVSGSIVELDVTLLDNFNNIPYVLATAQMTVTVGSVAQTISFADSDFQLDIDTDNDGVANNLERVAGTDPFNPPLVLLPNPVSCTIDPIPTASGLPGDSVTVENISSFIDCGADSFAINGSDISFSWNQVADSISWVIPADSIGGGIFELQIDVVNPVLLTEVYQSATVLADVEVEVVQCTQTTRLVQIPASSDVFLQNNRVFNNDELRVNSINRTTLISFDVEQQESAPTAAGLVVTVAEDDGRGLVDVYQDDVFEWSESDTSISLPDLTRLVGGRDGVWEIDVPYTIALTALFVNGPVVNLFLQQGDGGNDVSFTSRETGVPPVLVLEYTGCFDDA